MSGARVHFAAFQPVAEGYVRADRIKTSALRRCSLAPYVPLRFYPSGSASARTYPSTTGVPRRKTIPLRMTEFERLLLNLHKFAIKRMCIRRIAKE